MHMHVYHFQFYGQSDLVFCVTRVTHVPNLRKVRQKLWSLSWYFRQTDTQTYTQVIFTACRKLALQVAVYGMANPSVCHTPVLCLKWGNAENCILHYRAAQCL